MRLAVLLIALALVLAAATAAALMPRYFSHQGVLKDSDGVPVDDGSYDIQFMLYDASTGGTQLWSESQSVQVEDGIYNVTLGTVSAMSLAFDQPLWLAISVEGEPELAPRTAVTPVPYALRAAIADSVRPTAIIDDGDWEVQGSDVWHDGNVGVGPGATSPTHPLEVTGNAYFYNNIDVTGSSNLQNLYVYGTFYHYNGDHNIVNGDLSIHSGKLLTQRISPYGILEITDGVYPAVAVDVTGAAVGIGTSSPVYTLDVAGTTNTTALRMSTGASSGRVLTSDASGNASWQAPALRSGKFNCNADYALLVDCNGAQLLQNGTRDAFRIHSNASDASVCYTYYLNGTQVSKATLSAGANYDFAIPMVDDPHHAEVILSRPWAGGAVARVDIFYDNSRCGGVWHSSH